MRVARNPQRLELSIVTETQNQIGQYQIEGQIGEGGMGAVYKGRHVHLGMTAAIKTILRRNLANDEAIERLRDEGRALAQLQHVNIVRVLDFFTSEGNYYLVMEFVEGQSLKERLDQSPLDLGESLRIMRAVGTGLVAAHSRNILHRDLKPSNVMLGNHDEVKLTDFGLAKFMGAASRSKAGFVIGTPRYMAPESVRGDEVDERSDQYAFGILLYKLVTGAEPFTGGTPLEVMSAQVSKLPQPPRELNPHIPLPLQDLIMKTLEKDPNNRYPGMARLMVDLNHLVKGVITSNFEPQLNRTPVESPTVAIARSLEAALEPTLTPGSVEIRMGSDGRTELHSDSEFTSLPVENISPAREMRSTGSLKTPSAQYPRLAGSPVDDPPPPVNQGRRLLLGIVVFAAVSALVWWLMRERPVSEPGAVNAAAQPAGGGSDPGAQHIDAVIAPRFDLHGVPVSLFVEGDLPPALRSGWTGSEQIIASEFMTRAPAELRAQITPQLPHAALFSAWLALREGHSGDCIHNAGLARAGAPLAGRYLEAACELAALNYPSARVLSDFPEARFNHEVTLLLTGPEPGAGEVAGLFAQSDKAAALYLAGRYRLTTREAAVGRTLLNRARSLAHSSVEKTEIEKYMTGQ